jgi:hypothetical protein
MGNGTSGTVTLQPVTGALGTVVASLPANTGTLAETNLAQSWSANQGFTSAAPQLTIGQNAVSNGQITFNGSTSGSVLLRSNVAAGTGTVFELPATNGTAGYLLQTDGSGITSWYNWKGTANAFTAQQQFTPIATVTPSGATITWAVGAAQVAQVTLTSATDHTMASPTGMVSGGTYLLYIVQPASGSAATLNASNWGAVWKFPGGTKPTATAALNAVDLISCVSLDGTNMQCIFQADFK